MIPDRVIFPIRGERTPIRADLPERGNDPGRVIVPIRGERTPIRVGLPKRGNDPGRIIVPVRGKRTPIRIVLPNGGMIPVGLLSRSGLFFPSENSFRSGFTNE
jgi:hypothetical protein